MGGVGGERAWGSIRLRGRQEAEMGERGEAEW